MKKNLINVLKVVIIVVYILNLVILEKNIIEGIVVNKKNSQSLNNQSFRGKSLKIYDRISSGEENMIGLSIALSLIQLIGIFLTIKNKDELNKIIFGYFVIAILLTSFIPIKFYYSVGGIAGLNERTYITTYAIHYETNR